MNRTTWKSFLPRAERIFVFIILLVFTLSCSNTIEEIEKVTYEAENLPDVSSKDIIVYYSDSANLKIIMKAPVVERFISKGIKQDIMPEGLTVIFLDKEGLEEARVTSNYAIHYTQKAILELSNDVRVVNRDGNKLNSEHLVWDERNKKIFSDDFVKITTPEEIIYGDGFESNQDLDAYKIKHIKSIIELDDEEI